MSEPEILRRCSVCGAASRPSALFCPQCGNATARTKSRSGALDPVESQQALSEQSVDREARKPDLPKAALPSPVEKVRKASGVLIEQATYDPSVRFVVVAAVLFVLFLVILLLSKIMT